MPRTTKVDSPGCPPLRALTFDVLGLVKVIEAKDRQGGAAQVVERWGEPDFSKSVLAASINDRRVDPLLAVARKNGLVEILSPINGNTRASYSNVNDGEEPETDAITGLHLFKKESPDMSSRLCTLLTCTTKGNATIKEINNSDSTKESDVSSLTTWSVAGSGSVFCTNVDGPEQHALFGGKGVELNVWDLVNSTKIWTAKSPPKNSLGIFTPTWFTSATFLNKDDHCKFVGGTNFHKVHVYDSSAQRRPVLSFEFRETAIKSITADLDGNTIYVGNGSGDLASYDVRTGKLLGCFLGKCSGSIRSIARHPELPIIASCGLDSYLRIWDIHSRQLLSAVFLKQHLTSVVLDSNFTVKEPVVTAQENKVRNSIGVDSDEEDSEDEEDEEEDLAPKKRKKAMQPKISRFFKPPKSDDLGLSEIERPQISVTYARKKLDPDTRMERDMSEAEVMCMEVMDLAEKDIKPTIGSKSLNKKRSYAQLHLELGQSDFLLHSCSVCGLKYAPGEVDDEKIHTTFHKNYTHGLPFKGWSNERVIQTPSTDGRIVVVQDGDHPAHRNKVQEVLKIMETDLGDSGINHQLCKVYLFISAQRVAGCLVAEPLKFAHRILSSCVNEKLISHATKGQQKPVTLQFGGICFQREVIRRGPSIDENKLSNGKCSGAIFCENETVPVACGIRAIWVTPSNRRKHIATQLLDAVRKSFLDGVVLEKNQLAFAQPTSDGKILAAKYTGITTFLVY